MKRLFETVILVCTFAAPLGFAAEAYPDRPVRFIVHVPYKGAGPAVLDLLAGNVNIMFANPTSTVPHVKAGRLRARRICQADS